MYPAELAVQSMPLLTGAPCAVRCFPRALSFNGAVMESTQTILSANDASAHRRCLMPLPQNAPMPKRVSRYVDVRGDIVPDSPTSRTLQSLRKDGFIAAVVEKWNPHAKIRQDLFGFIDLVAMRYGELLAVQATSTGNIQSRVQKSLESPNLYAWLLTGARFECWGWAKRGDRGKRKVWTCKRVELVLVGTEVEVINHDA